MSCSSVDTVPELRTWKDFDLEQQGRLTHPLRYDPETDKYTPYTWGEAFAAIGRDLRALEPRSVIFYASGRASLETSYCYALFARLFGCNNLPDSSNMCHETTSVALKEVIGAAVGTTTTPNATRCSSSARTPARTVRASCKIVTFNPIRERGLVEFIDPQHPGEMITGNVTRISCQYHQVTVGGDIAALTGMCKHLFALDDAARAEGRARVLDTEFIEHHTGGFAAFERFVDDYLDWLATSWALM